MTSRIYIFSLIIVSINIGFFLANLLRKNEYNSYRWVDGYGLFCMTIALVGIVTRISMTGAA